VVETLSFLETNPCQALLLRNCCCTSSVTARRVWKIGARVVQVLTLTTTSIASLTQV